MICCPCAWTGFDTRTGSRSLPGATNGDLCYLHHHADPKRDFGPKIRTRRFLSVFDLTLWKE